MSTSKISGLMRSSLRLAAAHPPCKRPIPAQFATSTAQFVSRSSKAEMAEVVDQSRPSTLFDAQSSLAAASASSSSSSSKLMQATLDIIDPIAHHPDPLLVSPVPELRQTENTQKQEKIGRPIYLDMQATTPLDPRVLDAMMPFMTNQYGNPHSKTHAYGWETEKAVETARSHVADLIGASTKDIVFTSGATETNNMSIKGVSRFYKERKRHIITTQTEHKCVLDSCRVLQDEGFDVTYLPVKSNGLIDLQELADSIRPDTILVSIMAVNNEIGIIQPLKEIGAIIRRHKGVFFHTDAAQAVGKIPIDVEEMQIDLLSMSSHKVYGPKGIGAAYVRRRPRVRLEPIMNGGGQERGLRSGTVPAPLVVGFGEACRIAKLELQNDHEHVSRLSQRLHDKITQSCTHIVRNGDEKLGYAGCLNLSFEYIEGESLLMALKDVALSSGSACTSASLEPSYVLRALGASDENAHSSLRFGIGRFTTEQEVDYVADKIVDVVTRLRELSPLWEMVQEGIDLKSINWSQH
ncbi:cysteine desulfurase [Puccinia graminis f. sp. tritici]|uniref:cysteine desulfurase n=1 Tax=Puccinia graminis f. sp. tritici TaxID=56615 RepID=A0A5B0P802_PUCGR|nr:cysteine desulfurase [Puccinia graminis f. sp. tritici]KAA1131681.1 cysteine desulfurase [Puccinia graminis f. sp. tritici]